MLNIIKKLKSKLIRNIFDEYNIKHIYLFGSYARGEQNKNSDIDIIYEEKKGNNFSLFDLLNMKEKLENNLGKNIDFVDKSSINKYYISSINNDKILIF